MNEKYEIIIKENGEEIKRVSAKGFLLTAMEEYCIYNLGKGHLSCLEIALLTNANKKLVDDMWAKCGVTRKEREHICGLARMAKMAVEKGAEE